MRKLKAKNGFTLVELCIVLGIFAVIATMVVTSSMFLFKQNSDIQNESSFITDVTAIQREANNWLKKYDNSGYTITNNAGQTKLEARKGGEVSSLTFTENALTADGVELTDKCYNVSGIIFQIIEDKAADGTVEGMVAQITVTAKNGNDTETQMLLFPLFSNKTRERSVTGKNG